MSDPARSPILRAGHVAPVDALVAGLSVLHAEFARDLSVQWSRQLRTPIDVQFKRAEATDERRFIAAIARPACCLCLTVNPPAATCLLDIQPSILLAIIDRLLGGGNEPCPALDRPLTDIEHRLVTKIAVPCVAELQSAWQKLGETTFALERIASDPQIEVLAPTTGYCVSFELATGRHRGGMRLFIPAALIESLESPIRALAPSLAPTADDPATPSANPAATHPSVLVAKLDSAKMLRRDLADLRPGDIITTPHEVDAPWTVLVDGVPKFHARPGSLDGHKAVRIEGPIEPPTT